MIPIFLILKKFKKLRVSSDVETRGNINYYFDKHITIQNIKGVDMHIHGESAYPLNSYGHGWDEFEDVFTIGGHRPVQTQNSKCEYQNRNAISFDLVVANERIENGRKNVAMLGHSYPNIVSSSIGDDGNVSPSQNRF